jgi:hypothetical protein
MTSIAPKSALRQLVKLVKHDLKVRSNLLKKNELTKFGYHPEMKKVHEENLVFLEDFLCEFGWPKPSIYGKEVFEAAWMIAIHAIEKKDQMKKALEEVKKLLDMGEDVAYEYAALYDRVSLYEKNFQRFGMQLFPSPTGWYAKNLQDPLNVDKLRAQIGLCSLQAKIQEFNDSDEPGIVDEQVREEEHKKFLEWVNKSDWRK